MFISSPYFKLTIASLLPVIATVVLYLLEKKTPFGTKLPYAVRQLIIGILFGGLAVIGTEWGIPMNGAQVNCRDAAVLTGGLMFGAPAGIIAGLIGGIERWFAVYWGVGTFTRVACSVSTIIAGFYAAVLRKHMFENKKPGVLLSFAIGVVMEVLHLTMVFITNMNDPQKAMSVVRACTMPMVIANGVSVFLAAIALALISKEKHTSARGSKARISQTIQRWMLVSVALAFVVTSFFVFRLQDEIARRQCDAQLSQAIEETAADLLDVSDEKLLELTKTIQKETVYRDLAVIAKEHNVAEISIIDKNGIIIDSNVPKYVGFDMHSGSQASEFLCLLGDTKEYVQNYGATSSDSELFRKYAGIKTDMGFLQVGYDYEQFRAGLGVQVRGFTKNSSVGNNGYVLILDRDLNVVSTPKEYTADMFAGEAYLSQYNSQDVTVLTTLLGKRCYSRSHYTEGFCIVAVLPEDEAMQMRNIALYVNTFMEILVFAVLFALIYLLIKKVVVDRIKLINGSLARITGGDLGEIVNVRSNEEFASLSDDINSTVDTLKRYIDEASARIDKELEFAKSIQASALPNVFPAFPKRKEFDIFASMDPAKEVGGDFYDLYMTENDRLHFLIADVSGKGIPAAMFMMRAKTELKTLTEAGTPLNEVFTRGNAALCEGNDAGMFVTAWQCGIDLATGSVTYANAGHNPPLVRHADGRFEYLKTRAGFVLAGMDSVKYKTQELTLTPGDIIFLYTDGVTEATNADNELYGEERLINFVNDHEFDSMKELCEAVRADVDAFVLDAPQFDDITMVAFRYLGLPPVPTVTFDHCAIDDIPAVTEFIENELEKREVPMKTVVQINIAIDELYSNIVKYGYPGEEKGRVTVQLIDRDEPRRVCIRFEDEGIPYNPLTKEDPDVTLSAEDRKIGGLGIFMVKKTMDDVKYKYENGLNILTITKDY